MPFKMTEEKLICEASAGRSSAASAASISRVVPDDAPRYQELLYEAGRVELAPDLSVEVASPEDVEHYAHLERTGTAPEIVITRSSREHNSA